MYCQSLSSKCKHCVGNHDRKVIIRSPTHHDVLFGRGGSINSHEGNILFRHVVNQYKDAYFRANKHCKPKIANEVVQVIYNLNPPGRFLAPVHESQRNYKKNGCISWYNVGLKRARAKASQCLRERIRDDTKRQKSITKVLGDDPKAVSKSSSTFSYHSRSIHAMMMQQEEKGGAADISNQIFRKKYPCHRSIAAKRIQRACPQHDSFLFPPKEISYRLPHNPTSLDVNASSNSGKISNFYQRDTSNCNEEDKEQLLSCTSWIGSFFSVEYHSLGTSITLKSPILTEGQMGLNAEGPSLFYEPLPCSLSTVSDITYQSEDE